MKRGRSAKVTWPFRRDTLLFAQQIAANTSTNTRASTEDFYVKLDKSSVIKKRPV